VFFSQENWNHMVLLGALFGVLSLLTISASSRAEPSALDAAPPTKEDKPDTDKPKEKKPITVPVGTVIMVKTGEEVSSDDAPGRKFSATLQANLMTGDDVIAKQGSQVYGQVMKSQEVGRIVAKNAQLALSLTSINIEGTLYPITTGNFSESSTKVLRAGRNSVKVPAGSILEFKLTSPLTVKK
jgi:hypothetical protein